MVLYLENILSTLEDTISTYFKVGKYAGDNFAIPSSLLVTFTSLIILAICSIVKAWVIQ